MHKTAVINVVGLTADMLGPTMPRLTEWAGQGRVAQIEAAFPAVTCTAQSDYLTGVAADQHGIVGNGWYFRDECEVRFWRQSNKLVEAPKIWERAREADSSFTCANLFWWYNMYSSVDYAVTPRPMYPSDGRKLPDIYTQPASLRDELQAELGTFPLFDFWGPKAGIPSSEWIAESAKRVEEKHNATLTLVYLPHLDYNLQRLGPSDAAMQADLTAIDRVAGDLVEFFEKRGARVIVLSEYGITDVSKPIHLNRVLREHGLIAIREELGLDLLDPGASAAFAVADHQVAHVYVNDPARLEQVHELVAATPGVESITHIGHPRSGELVAVAAPDAWFTYYYWLDDARAPDFARTVDIHRKPGYDPVELFIDPTLTAPMAKIGWTLAKKKLGLRTLLDVIGLDASIVKGSHGRTGPPNEQGPLLISRAEGAPTMKSVDVYQEIWRSLLE